MKNVIKFIVTLLLLIGPSCTKEKLEFPEPETQLQKTDFKGKPKSLPPNEENCFFIRYEGMTSNYLETDPKATVNFRGEIWSLTLDEASASGNRAGTAQLWSSNDGKEWTLRRTNPFNGRKHGSLVVHNDRLWMMGGVNGANQHLIDIWSSANGIDWKIEAFAPFNLGYRGQGRVTTFQNKIFVFTTWYQNSDVLVYSSSDGKRWTLETSNAFGTSPQSSIQIFETVVLGNALYVLGFEDHYSGTRFKIFRTINGGTWRRITYDANSISTPLFGAWRSSSVVQYNGLVWLIGGRLDFSTTRAIWFTSDMRSWTEYQPKGKVGSYVLDVDGPLVYDHSTIPFNDKLLIFGGKYGDSSHYPSDNLKVWTLYKDCIEESK